MSGEEYRKIQLEMPPSKRNNAKNAKTAAVGIATVVVLGVCIYAGITYQKYNQVVPPINTPKQNSPNNSSDGDGVSNGTGSGGGADGNSRGTGHSSVTGTVTAISATSITVQSSESGNAQTLAITSNTSISDAKTQSFGDASSGQNSTANIHIGDKVLVTPDAANPDQAIGILLNPV